ncbi:MAG: hypothetical protein ACLTPE_09440 [Lactobacillus paragasseri]
MEEEKIFEKRWQLASSEQRARYNNLITSYPTVDWTYKEKKYGSVAKFSDKLILR